MILLLVFFICMGIKFLVEDVGGYKLVQPALDIVAVYEERRIVGEEGILLLAKAREKVDMEGVWIDCMRIEFSPANFYIKG